MFKISTENDNFIILYLELVLYLWLTRCLLLFRQSYIHSIYPSWCGRRALCAGLPDCRHRAQYNSLGLLFAVHRWYMVQTSILVSFETVEDLSFDFDFTLCSSATCCLCCATKNLNSSLVAVRSGGRHTAPNRDFRQKI